MSRRIFTIITIVLIIGVVGFFGYNYFKNRGASSGAGTTSSSSKNFFPFGGTTTTPPANTTDTPAPTSSVPVNTTDNGAPSKLHQITPGPVVGYTVVTKIREKIGGVVASPAATVEVPPPAPAAPAKTTAAKSAKKTKTVVAPVLLPNQEFATAIRYIDQASGNIFDAYADTRTPKRLSNTTIPRLHDAVFAMDGGQVILRYIKDDNQTIESFLGTVPAEVPDGADLNPFLGTFLPEGITDYSVSPDGKKFFFMTIENNQTVGETMDFATKLRKQIFTSSFTEWKSDWSTATTITLTPRATGLMPGFTYSLDATTGSFKKIFGGISGLTSLLSSDSSILAYSQSVPNDLRLMLYSTAQKEGSATGLHTTASKCVFNKSGANLYCGASDYLPNAIYPDAWYRGEMQMTDSIWKINTLLSTDNTLLENPLDDKGVAIDAVNLQLDPSEKYLFFQNKRDGTLWELEL